MNKKEINKFKKEFKSDSSSLKINEIYNVYLKKDNSSILYSKLDYFDMLESEVKELYLANFKKIIGGTLHTKLLQLSFQSMEEENAAQGILHSALRSEGSDIFVEDCDSIVDRIKKDYSYDTDIVITFIRGEYWGSKIEALESEDGITYFVPFVMASINKVEPFKKTLMFNFEEKEFRPSNTLDTSINLNAPVEGFMFPCFFNGYEDINKIMFYTSKPKELNYRMVEDVLNCTMKLTAEEEKTCFTDIIKNVIGESVKPELIENIYSRISGVKEMCEEHEDEVISLHDLKSILEDVDVKEAEALEVAFEGTCGKDYNFHISNILPDYNSKSLKIWNEELSISMSPKNLGGVKQIRNEEGTRCLVIELEDDIVVEGFKLITEE